MDDKIEGGNHFIDSLMTESLLHRNQSIDLQSKTMDWFLYDRDLRHERVKKPLLVGAVFFKSFPNNVFFIVVFNRRIQNPVKHLRWSDLRKLFSENASSQMFDKALNISLCLLAICNKILEITQIKRNSWVKQV